MRSSSLAAGVLTVVQQARILAPVAHTWNCLTQPALLKGWFADTDKFDLGESFCLSFGDGDFFRGTVIAWREPSLLRLKWQFMGLGPEFEVTFELTAISETETDVKVADKGAFTVEEAQSLTEGWADFLTRLAGFAMEGHSTRYTWSETISIGALLQRSGGGELLCDINDETWWSELFAGAKLTFEKSADSLRILFEDENWDGRSTNALIQIKPFDSGTYCSVIHDGWNSLLNEQQLPERRRYAGLWRAGLAALENHYQRI